ncbi:MAG: hypothetical protein IPK83_07225 [Planctomycetes bacterium]|nr:hypothetical protein [Planctomycetota bacterium]
MKNMLGPVVVALAICAVAAFTINDLDGRTTAGTITNAAPSAAMIKTLAPIVELASFVGPPYLDPAEFMGPPYPAPEEDPTIPKNVKPAPGWVAKDPGGGC